LVSTVVASESEVDPPPLGWEPPSAELALPPSVVEGAGSAWEDEAGAVVESEVADPASELGTGLADGAGSDAACGTATLPAAERSLASSSEEACGAAGS
jgi:hypothetical protein